MQDCIFCKIVNKEVPSEIVAETDSLIAINDIKPSADTHILLIPKMHLATFLDLPRDSDYLKDAVELAQKLIKEKAIESAYKLIFNGGKYQYVSHLHWHLLGGEMKGEAI